MNEIIDSLADSFEQFPLSPSDWPVHVTAAAAGPATFRRWPDFPKSATMESGRLGHGRGADPADSLRRALGEMIEVASCCAWGNEAVFDAAFSEVADKAWGPAEIGGFADWQRRDRADWNSRLVGVDWIPPEIQPDMPIGWMRARRLDTDGDILLPADAVLIGRRENLDADACAVADTNGCAAGATGEDAILAALYELIERDATARWWYGQRACRQIDPARIDRGEAIVQGLSKRERVLWLLDITSDIAVPTVAAVACDPAGRHVGVGFATRASLAAAAYAALSELMQIELKIAAAIVRPGLMPDMAQWFGEIDFGGCAPFGEVGPRDLPLLAEDIEPGLDACRTVLLRSRCRIAVIDMTRHHFGIPVVRAISPDLCHWKPRFGRSRLTGRERGGMEDGCRAHAASAQPLLRV